jgi:hypothetical protein
VFGLLCHFLTPYWMSFSLSDTKHNHLLLTMQTLILRLGECLTEGQLARQ